MSTGAVPIREIAEARVQSPRGEVPFRLFKTEVCFKIVNDIFAGTTYPHVDFVKDVRTVLDIGANVGAAALYLATAYPQARVYAFEPGAAAFDLLNQNVQAFPNICAFPFGLYAQEKAASLYGGVNDCVESSVYASARASGSGEEIRLRSAPDFLAQHGIESVDVLKLDTEGCEVPILRSLCPYLPAMKLIYVEYHSERDRRLIDELLAETHVLWRGQASLVYRGEFCYLNRALVPPESETHTCEILHPLD